MAKRSPPTVKILLMGSAGVGKTTLTRRLENQPPLGDKMVECTISLEYIFAQYKFGTHEVTVQYMDPPGATSSIVPIESYFRNLHGLIGLVDASNLDTYTDLRDRWIATAATKAGGPLPLLVIVNKMDLIKLRDERRHLDERVDSIKEELSTVPNIQLVDVRLASARNWVFPEGESPLDGFVTSILTQFFLAQSSPFDTSLPRERIDLLEKDFRSDTQTSSCC